MKQIKKALATFIKILDAANKGWRFYSSPIEGEHSYQPLRASIEAGKHVADVERHILERDELNAWKSLCESQAAFYYPISPEGKGLQFIENKSKAGRAYRNQAAQDKAVGVAIKLFSAGTPPRNIVTLTTERLSHSGVDVTQTRVREWLNELLITLKKR